MRKLVPSHFPQLEDCRENSCPTKMTSSHPSELGDVRSREEHCWLLVFLVPEDFRKFRILLSLCSSHHTHGVQRKGIYAAEIGSQTGQGGAICVLPKVEAEGRKGISCLSPGTDLTSQAAS